MQFNNNSVHSQTTFRCGTWQKINLLSNYEPSFRPSEIRVRIHTNESTHKPHTIAWGAMKMHKVWRVDANITFAARNLISRNAVWREPFMVIRWYALLNRHITDSIVTSKREIIRLAFVEELRDPGRSLYLHSHHAIKVNFSTSITRMCHSMTNASAESFGGRESVIKAIGWISKLLIFALIRVEIYILVSRCILIGFLHHIEMGSFVFMKLKEQSLLSLFHCACLSPRVRGEIRGAKVIKKSFRLVSRRLQMWGDLGAPLYSSVLLIRTKTSRDGNDFIQKVWHHQKPDTQLSFTAHTSPRTDHLHGGDEDIDFTSKHFLCGTLKGIY
jgi:hypothetical protein